MAVSVIISNFNGARFLPRLLDTLQAQQGVELEIIVVERHSTDGSAEMLARYPAVRIVREPPQSGLVAGYAAGVPHARHPHLFFCNEDMWFDPGCLAALERHLNPDARVIAADPWQWTYDGKDWIHGGVRFGPARWAINDIHPFRRANPVVGLPAGAVIPYPCAGAFLMSRVAYDELGGWDTSIFLDNEDTDLFLRAWQRGWKAVTVPDAKVYHAVGMSNPGAQAAAAAGRPPPTVGRRRYVSNRMGKSLLPLKYFSSWARWIAVAGWLVTFANNLCKLRLEYVRWDLAVLREMWCRRRAVAGFRHTNAAWNRRMPGEKFFTAPEFQAGST